MQVNNLSNLETGLPQGRSVHLRQLVARLTAARITVLAHSEIAAVLATDGIF